MIRRAVRISVLSCAVLCLTAGSIWAATINGTARNDTLRGGARADAIYGRGGNDRLFGAGGNDLLVGGPGNDVLIGGLGADKLRCGPGRDTATRDLRDQVARDCEVVRGPKPLPPAPPPAPALPPPPPPPVDAPATFVLGAGVTAEQQAGIKRGLDIGATYFRTGLGRDLPPITVYVDDDLEGIVNLYAQTYPTSIERSRQNWQAATAAVAAPRRTWVYTGSTSWRPDNSQKIMVHEAFHILQYELAGSTALDGASDVVPRVGPQWLTEGTAEYVAYRGIASAALVQISEIRAQWIRRTKLTASPLRSRETGRGLFGEPEPYQISPLAVDFLLATRSDTLLVAYYEAIGRGEAWQSAFATVFGKSVEAFYAEFEAHRSGL